MQRSIGSSRQVFAPRSASGAAYPNTTPPKSLYIHIPFCFHKCHYCDFYSIVDRQDRQAAFTDRLIRELRAQASYFPDLPLETVFVGGGTPTLLAPKLWERLLAELHSVFDLSEIRDGKGEFSVECNPETVDNQIAEVLAGGGVNRASIGAQSFNTDHLKALERHHNPDRVPEALETLGNAGISRRSIDLIYAIPGQTLEDFDADLEHALSLPIEHISAYGLTYEPNTAMTARLNRGQFSRAPEKLEVDMYNHCLATFDAAGFKRYEVSNHAKPGAECLHNMNYWRSEPWLAVGPSASGHLNGYRWKNTPRLDDYLKLSDRGFAPICDIEPPDTRRALMDLLMTSIRLSEGVDAVSARMTASTIEKQDQLCQAVQSCHDSGWIEHPYAERWVLTDHGFLFADRVGGELIGALLD